MVEFSNDVAQLREASRQTVRQLGFMGNIFAKTGCTHSQCHILLELDLNGLLTVSELADILLQDKSTTSRSVGSLVDKKLIQTTIDSNDGRVKQLKLTTSGTSRVNDIHALANKQVSDALAQLSDQERETVVNGMSIYAKALNRSRQLADVEFRQIKKSDDEAMSQVIRRVMTEFGAVGCGFSIEDPEVNYMSKSYSTDRSAFFVAVRNGQLLGGAGLAPLQGTNDPDVCELRKMYVLPEGRGLGLGRRLMDLCLDTASKFNYSQIYLETLSSMVQARYLYDKYGFEQLEAPMGATGHSGCNMWASRKV